MEGLSFIPAPAIVTSDPVRMDVACFVGFVARRQVASRIEGEADRKYIDRVLPSWLSKWLTEQNWISGWYGRCAKDLVQLLNVPVAVDSWETFNQLFSWESRPLDGKGQVCHTSLGVAVKTFFKRGGRRCYIVRVGDPWQYLISDSNDNKNLERRRSAPEALFSSMIVPSANDRTSWKGAGHLFGLPDVSYLAMPDLPEVFGVESWPLKTTLSSDCAEEIFVESGSRTGMVTPVPLRSVCAPSCDIDGFKDWVTFVSKVGGFLRDQIKEVTFIAAVPLPISSNSLDGDPYLNTANDTIRRRTIAAKVRDARKCQWQEVERIGTAFVQLVYPWYRDNETSWLPGDLAPPDGLFTGVLAMNARTDGVWQSIIRKPLSGIVKIEPVLDTATLEGAVSPRLRDRVTLMGPTSGGIRVLSDVTADVDLSYRPANISRLLCAVIRMARQLGQQSVFENNGDILWYQIRERFTSMLCGFWSEGAFSGETPSESFDVRCDRSTMTQSDIDSGRLIVRIEFTAAKPVTQIVVVLAMNNDGKVSIVNR